MQKISGIPIQNFLSKAQQEDRAFKIAAIRGLRSYECEHSNWAVDQVIKHIRTSNPECSVNDVLLPSYQILSAVSNDPNDSNFDPNDQLPLIIEVLKRADILLFASKETLGFPDSNTVRLLERLILHINETEGESPEPERKPFFERTPVGIVAYGDCAVYNAGLTLSGAVNKLGATVVRHGLAVWDKNRGNIFKEREFAVTLERMSRDLIDLLNALR